MILIVSNFASCVGTTLEGRAGGLCFMLILLKHLYPVDLFIFYQGSSDEMKQIANNVGIF